MRSPVPLLDDDSGVWPETREQAAKRIELERNAPGRRCETWTRRVDEHRAAAASNAWPRVVVELDNKIVKMIGPLQPVSTGLRGQFHRPVIMPIGRILTPAIIRANPLRR